MVTLEEDCLLHLMNFKYAACLQGPLTFRGVRRGSSPHGIGPGGKEEEGHYGMSREVMAKFLQGTLAKAMPSAFNEARL